ncbi:MAG: methyltransferase domain-containing protein [Chlamydiales bacterium]|nr:methyltransferase domain-containing protein [Chlamydiales bacterium]
MFDNFALFSKPTDLAHSYWKKILGPGDSAIDATCGNGKDTLFLAKHIVEGGRVIGIDIQEEALAKTRELLKGELTPEQLERVSLFRQSHAAFPPLANELKIKIIVYNLGYLPGGDKKITSQTESTLESLNKSLSILAPGGVISVTCYPGHEEGLLEQEALLQLLTPLPSSAWSVCHHKWLNRNLAPSLIIIQNKNNAS